MKALCALLLLAGCASKTAEQSDWERLQGKPAAAESEVQMPAFPVAARLVEFEKGNGSGFRFYIDPATLSVGKDRVVRYVLVARSQDDAQSVSYEALRCDTADYRVYAFGQRDGTWTRARTSWRPLSSAQPRQYILFTDYFCPQKVPILDPAEGVRALQDGGHPFAKGFGSPLGR